MNFRSQLNKAIGDHSQWKKRLTAAIEAGNSRLTADQVARPEACDVGKWLHGTSIPESVRKTPDFEACRDLHVEFHKAAAEVMRLALAGDKAAARAAVGTDSRFANLSSALTLRMMQWAASAG